MLNPKFSHYDLTLVEPDFDSSATDLIIELDHLRRKELNGSTHPGVFFQLKNIFHLLESVGSARIEGNNTTLLEYIDSKERGRTSKSDAIQEIINLEKAMDFVEEVITSHPINRSFISELHQMVVVNLRPPPVGEGDTHPGRYRLGDLQINRSNHLPPSHTAIDGYMSELFDFIARDDAPKYDLLKTAIAHHRFAWVHPFGNGNGRTVRLLTYAMLIGQGFNVNVGRIINPTAVFCSSRDDYYANLAKADTGTKEGILTWCEYVLKGLKEEIEKIDRLCNYDFLNERILQPAFVFALDQRWISDRDKAVLAKVAHLQLVQAGDLKSIFENKQSAEISRQVKRLKDAQMLMPEKEGRRKYHLCFQNKFLMRAIIHMLAKNEFLPVEDSV